jgi:hypothetical protein
MLHLSYCILNYEEYILKELSIPDFPLNALHHRVIFISQEAFHHPTQASLCAIETKYFIPLRHIDWLKNPIPSHNAFEEENMANISPIVKIDISIKLGTIEEITIGVAFSP